MAMVQNLQHLLSSELKQAIYRFPVSFSIILLACALCIMYTHDINVVATLAMPQLLAVLFCGFFASVAFTLIAECHHWQHRWDSGLTLGLCVLLYPCLTLTHTWPRFGLLACASILFALLAPFLLRSINDRQYAKFYVNCLINLAIALMIALLVSIGLIAIVSGVGLLFSTRISYKIYSDCWIISSVLVGASYLVASLPTYDEINDPTAAYPKTLLFITSYILVPMLLAYTLIIYAYMIKLAILMQLINNEIALLIIPLTLGGILTDLLIYALANDSSAWLRTVQRVIYPLLIVPILLLGAAITMRIQQYGITEVRYLVAIYSLWLLVGTCYATFRRPQLFKFMPLALCILLLLAAVGPWGQRALSGNSQLQRLTALLQKHDMLDDNHIVRVKHAISFADNKSIASIIEYMFKTQRVDLIKPWFPQHQALFNMPFTTAIENVLQVMGIAYIPAWQISPAKQPPHFSIDIANKPINIKGFTTLEIVNFSRPTPDAPWTSSRKKNGVILAIDKRNVLTLRDWQQRQMQFDFNHIATRAKQLNIPAHVQKKQQKQFILKATTQGLRAKLLITDLYLDDQPNQASNIRFMLLLSD